MASNIDAVIAALRVVLADAERSRASNLDTKMVNRWISLLPGAWLGRWRHLRLYGDFADMVPRDALIGHVRATLAYLESNREAIAAQRAWPFRRTPAAPATPAASPIDAEFRDLGGNGKLPKSSRKLVRLIKH